MLMIIHFELFNHEEGSVVPDVFLELLQAVILDCKNSKFRNLPQEYYEILAIVRKSIGPHAAQGEHLPSF